MEGKKAHCLSFGTYDLRRLVKIPLKRDLRQSLSKELRVDLLRWSIHLEQVEHLDRSHNTLFGWGTSRGSLTTQFDKCKHECVSIKVSALPRHLLHTVKDEREK